MMMVKQLHKLRFINSFRFMPASLSDLVDNLPETNKEECKACMNRENIKSDCEFIGHKNNKSYFKGKKCEKIWLKPSLLNIANSISEINKKNAKHAWKDKILNQNTILLGFKIIN